MSFIDNSVGCTEVITARVPRAVDICAPASGEIRVGRFSCPQRLSAKQLCILRTLLPKV